MKLNVKNGEMLVKRIESINMTQIYWGLIFIKIKGISMVSRVCDFLVSKKDFVFIV